MAKIIKRIIKAFVRIKCKCLFWIKRILNILYLSPIRAPRAISSQIKVALRKRDIIHTYDYLEKFKDIHKGKRAFFVGTGPSLSIDDVNMLNGEIVFGVNSLIDSICNITTHINYYCLADMRAVQLFYPKTVKSDVDFIFVANGRLNKKDVKSENTMLFPDTMRYLMFRNLFFQKPKLKVSDDITNVVYDGGTVIYVAMQIAAYMGINEMYLLGVDCNYAPGVKNFNEFRKDDEIQKGGNQYFQIGAFEKFKEYADEKGIRVFNATRGGKLEVFPRVTLEEVISKPMTGEENTCEKVGRLSK